jgi:hypothetical protein
MPTNEALWFIAPLFDFIPANIIAANIGGNLEVAFGANL